MFKKGISSDSGVSDKEKVPKIYIHIVMKE